MEIIGDPEGLVREIRELARRESAGIAAAAEEEARGILSAAEASAVKAGRELRAAALAGAEGRRQMLLASVPAEAGRLRSDRREALLDSIKVRAMLMLRAGAGEPAVLAALAAEAAGRMEGKKFIVALAPADRAAAAGLGGEIERLAGGGTVITLEEDPGLDGGVVVRDAEGRQRWDNSFKARLERFWPELRGRLLGENK